MIIWGRGNHKAKEFGGGKKKKVKILMSRDKVSTHRKTLDKVGKQLCLFLQGCAVSDGQWF